MGRILLIRHGQASVFSDNYDQLSELGIRQSQYLGKHFEKNKIVPNKIFTGPLQRQKDTARLAFENTSVNGLESKVLEGLREHEGFQIIKSVIPKLIEEDPEIREMASQEAETREDRIKNHMKIYEVISTRWIHGDLDYDETQFESWSKFKHRVAEVIPQIVQSTEKTKTSMIFSSGGPISVSIGHILGLSDEKILHLSWVIHNASISELIFNKKHISLKNFNTIPHLPKEELITLV